MKHLGDITKINGAEVEPVDVIIGGSPCQDLSVAGKRAGLDGERSGLFMEQIRIIKEMRDADKLRIERLSDTKIRGRSGTDNTSGKGWVCGDIRNTDAVSADCGEGGTTTIESGITQHGLCGAGQLVRPRYMVWENVPGAFSSNKAEDFRIVLEETARIADSNAVIPRPPKNKWATAGCIMGDGWSIAWRVLDAQFWGVPQRRRRIALVADFGGESAPEILFERQGVPGDIEASGEAGQGTARNAAGGAGEASGSLSAVAPFDTTQITSPQNKNRFEYGAPCHTLNAQAHVPSIVIRTAQTSANGHGVAEEVAHTLDGSSGQAVSAAFYQHKFGEYREGAGTLKTNCGQPSNGSGTLAVEKCYPINTQIITRHNALGRGTGFGLGEDGEPAYTLQAGHEHGVCASVAQTLNSRVGTGDGNAPLVMAHGQANAEKLHDQCPTLNCNHEQPIVFPVAFGGAKESHVASPLMANSGPNRHGGFSNTQFDAVVSVDCRNMSEADIHGTLQAKENGGQSLNYMGAVRTGYAVRRLTPLECERLQGFPDGWTDIPNTTIGGKLVKASDTARYKALGNSIALPPWRFVLGRIFAQGARSLGSLFDGIGGFPLIWSELGGITAWASEIEPFCIAVTTKRLIGG